MALSDEEKATLEALTAKANEPEEQPDFEMEIYDGPKGARIPYSRGRKWLQDNFNIDLDPDPAKETGDDGKDPAAKDNGKQGQKAAKSADPDPAGRPGHWSRRIDQHKTA